MPRWRIGMIKQLFFTFGCTLLACTTLIACASADKGANSVSAESQIQTAEDQALDPDLKTVVLGQQTIHYLDRGVGIPVVFVHGALGDYRNSDKLKSLLPDRYRVISYSRRYHYPNRWSDDGKNYGQAQDVEDLAGLIRALGLGRVHLVGSSYAGAIIALTALKYPELVSSVVIGEPNLRFSTRKPGAKRNPALNAIQEKIANGEIEQAAIDFYDFVVDEEGAFQKLPTDTQARWLANKHTLPLQFAATPFVVSCRDLKRSMKVKALVLTGASTKDLYRQGGRKLVNCLDKPSVSEIKDAGHMIFLDQPEAAAKLILDFFGRQD